jgi:uncharacterized protein (TIGR03435 family)
MSFTRVSGIRRQLWLVVFMANLAAGSVVGIDLCMAQTVAGQHSSDAPKKLAEFEVASIRPSKQDGSSWGCLPGGRITGVQTVTGLINLAFEVRNEQIVNMPEWGESDRYAISAIPPESSESFKIQYRTVYPSKEQEQMLQSLLAERFHLKFHREFKKEQAYLISLNKKAGDMKLEPPKDEHMPSYVSVHINDLETGSTSFVVLNSTIATFAREVGRYTKLNVIDRTGLTGSYEFKVPFYYLQKEVGSDIGASVLAGLGKFGFTVKSVKAPIELIVIDHVDRPSEN